MKCPHCGKEDRPWRDDNKKIIWKNFLLPDLVTTIWCVSLLCMLLAFHYADIECAQVRSDPCEYCPAYQKPIEPMADIYGNIIYVKNMTMG